MDVATGLGDRFARGVLQTFGVVAPYSDKDLGDDQRAELYEGAKAFAGQAHVDAVGDPRLLYVAYGPGSTVQSALIGFGAGDAATSALIAAERDAQGQLEFHLAEPDGGADVATLAETGLGLRSDYAAEPTGDLVGDLERLAALKSQGFINDQEFARAKGKLLS